MPNIKSAVKRMRTNRIRQERNRKAKSAMRTAVTKVKSALEKGDLDAAEVALPIALSLIGKNAKKGMIHKRTASRKTSRLAKKMNAARAEKETSAS